MRFQCLIPPVFGILCQTLSPESLKASEDFSPLTLSLSDYNEPRTFGGATSDFTELMTNFEDIVIGDGSTYVDADDNYGGNVTAAIITEGEKEITIYRNHYIVAAEFFEDDTIQENNNILKMFFNTIPFHSFPLAVNLGSNSLLSFLQKEGQENEIEVTTHPLSKTDTVRPKLDNCHKLPLQHD